MNAETQNREEGWSGYVLSVGRQAESEGSSPGPGRELGLWHSHMGVEQQGWWTGRGDVHSI